MSLQPVRRQESKQEGGRHGGSHLTASSHTRPLHSLVAPSQGCCPVALWRRVEWGRVKTEELPFVLKRIRGEGRTEGASRPICGALLVQTAGIQTPGTSPLRQFLAHLEGAGLRVHAARWADGQIGEGSRACRCRSHISTLRHLVGSLEGAATLVNSHQRGAGPQPQQFPANGSLSSGASASPALLGLLHQRLARAPGSSSPVQTRRVPLPGPRGGLAKLLESNFTPIRLAGT